jgi:hypothetical protein
MDCAFYTFRPIGKAGVLELIEPAEGMRSSNGGPQWPSGLISLDAGHFVKHDVLTSTCIGPDHDLIAVDILNIDDSIGVRVECRLPDLSGRTD